MVYILILFAIIALAFSLFPSSARPARVDLNTFIDQAKQGKFDTIQQDSETIIGLKNDKEITETGYIGSTDDLINTFEKSGITVGEHGVKIDVKSDGFDWGSLMFTFVPLILFGALLFFLFRSYRKKNVDSSSSQS